MYSIEEPFAENTSTREPQNYFNTKTVNNASSAVITEYLSISVFFLIC